MKVKNQEPKIALFIDYDNIAIGLKELGGQKFEISLIMERLLEKGRIIFKRAYADWYLFSQGKQPLHDAGIEMIDIPMRRHIGKNSADIRLVVDALDLCYTKDHIDTFVIGSGDSDFSPLVSKLKENNKLVIGFGLRSSTSNLLADNCDEFIYYEDLISIPYNRPPLPAGLSVKQHEVFTLVLDSIAALMREDKEVMWGSIIKDTIRRKKPDFTEFQYGYSSFSQLLEDAARFGLIGLIKDPKSGGTPVVTGFGRYTGDNLQSNRLSRPVSGHRKTGPSLIIKTEGSPKAVKNDHDASRKVQSNRKPITAKPPVTARMKFSLKRPLATSETGSKNRNSSNNDENIPKTRITKKTPVSSSLKTEKDKSLTKAPELELKASSENAGSPKSGSTKMKKRTSLPGRRELIKRGSSVSSKRHATAGRTRKTIETASENISTLTDKKSTLVSTKIEKPSIAELPVERLEKISSLPRKTTPVKGKAEPQEIKNIMPADLESKDLTPADPVKPVKKTTARTLKRVRKR